MTAERRQARSSSACSTRRSLGRTTEDALAAMAERIDSEDLQFVLMSVVIQREVGGSLAGLFQTVSETVRERQHFRLKVRALTAMGRISAYILVGLPFFIVGTVSLTEPRLYAPAVRHFRRPDLDRGRARDDRRSARCSSRRSSRSRGDADMLLVLAFLCLAGALALVGQMLTASKRDRQASLRRAQSYSVPGQDVRVDARFKRLSARHGDRLARFAIRFDPRAEEERIGLRLVASGLARTFSPTEFLAAEVVLGAAGVVLGGLLGVLAGSSTKAVILALVLGALGYVVLDVLVTLRTRARRDQMRRELPDALDILAVSVEAGLGFDGAIAKLSEHKGGPLVEQFELVAQRARHR